MRQIRVALGSESSLTLSAIVDWFGVQVLDVQLERSGRKFKMSLRSGRWDIMTIFIWATFAFRVSTTPY